MRLTIFLFFVLINFSCFAQEDDSLRVVVSHDVIDESKFNPNKTTTVENYINVNDSIDRFIDNMQKHFGQIEEENGVFVWQGVTIDSVGANNKIIMYHGVWTMKNEINTFQIVPTQKIKNLKKNEKRGIRMQIYLKNGKNALASKKYEIVIVALLEELLNMPAEEVKQE